MEDPGFIGLFKVVQQVRRETKIDSDKEAIRIAKALMPTKQISQLQMAFDTNTQRWVGISVYYLAWLLRYGWDKGQHTKVLEFPDCLVVSFGSPLGITRLPKQEIPEWREVADTRSLVEFRLLHDTQTGSWRLETRLFEVDEQWPIKWATISGQNDMAELIQMMQHGDGKKEATGPVGGEKEEEEAEGSGQGEGPGPGASTCGPAVSAAGASPGSAPGAAKAAGGSTKD